MKDFNYKKWNTITGWITFAIALITYTLTLEPTVSPWDCGEYISTSAKLSVGHPPGAPLFQMLGAFFSMFAIGTENIALMVNFMSGLASAFTILFMFWSITYIAKSMASRGGDFGFGEKFAVLGSGVVGALAYTFSDSFWFSAVEGEVYAMSSFLMALLLWLGLRWMEDFNKPRGHKWLILISFVVGLSFGVHILSLLVIPSVVMLYFFKTCKKVTFKNTAIASVVSILVLAFVFKVLFPLTLKFFSVSELFFINSVGLPYNSGSVIAFIVLVFLFYFGLTITIAAKKYMLNTLILSILFIMIGFSTWMMLPIRSNANTTINENSPSSARELLAYYNREQYGDKNVFYDTYYSTKYDRNVVSYVDDKPKYEKVNGRYEIVNEYKGVVPNYSNAHKGFIPRMVNPGSEIRYKQIVGIPMESQLRPTFLQNLKFMFTYQFGYMYGRYFMWNFVGRQDDIQGQLDNHGNWLSGINFIDTKLLGSQEYLTKEQKENKGRNTYFFLPLLLGIIGFVFQATYDKKNWYVLTLFFIFTGFAIIFYTNPKPFEARERDYAVVGSFYIFAMWIGFGVIALYDSLKLFANKKVVATGVTFISLLAVPVLMGFQNWDDHDRSDRYITHFTAKAYLESCDQNAILYTIGDNDTFPLWYLQEVEEVRTDVKCINTSLFATDWYIDQMRKATYEAPAIPSELTHEQYKYGSLDICLIDPEHYKDYSVYEQRLPLSKFMDFIKSNKPETFRKEDNGTLLKVLPTYKIRIPVNKENALKYGIVAKEDADKMVDYIDIDIDQGAIAKNTILMLDILNNFDWKRPICFTGGSPDNSEYLWLKDYLQLDGLVYKLVPIKVKKSATVYSLGRINTKKMYANMKNLDWSIFDKDFYIDEQARKLTIGIRNNMIRLAEALYKEGEKVKALEILDLSLEKMPVEKFGNHSIALGYLELYYQLKKPAKAKAIADVLLRVYGETILSKAKQKNFDIDSYDDLDANVFMYARITDLIIKNEEKVLHDNELKDNAQKSAVYIEKIKNKREKELREGFGVLINFSRKKLDWFSRISKEEFQDNFQRFYTTVYEYVDLIDLVDTIYKNKPYGEELKVDREVRLRQAFDIFVMFFKDRAEYYLRMDKANFIKNFRVFKMNSEKYREIVSDIGRIYSDTIYKKKVKDDFNRTMDSVKKFFEDENKLIDVVNVKE